MTREPATPVTPLAWPRWKWVLLLTAATFTVGVELVALFVITVTHQSTCFAPPYPPDVATGQRQLAHLALTVVAPWAVAVATLRPRRRMAVTAMACTSPAVAAWIGSQWEAFWVGGLCI